MLSRQDEDHISFYNTLIILSYKQVKIHCKCQVKFGSINAVKVFIYLLFLIQEWYVNTKVQVIWHTKIFFEIWQTCLGQNNTQDTKHWADNEMCNCIESDISLKFKLITLHSNIFTQPMQNLHISQITEIRRTCWYTQSHSFNLYDKNTPTWTCPLSLAISCNLRFELPRLKGTSAERMWARWTESITPIQRSVTNYPQ